MSDCNWIKDKNGNILGAKDSNGEKSKLFQDLENTFGLEKAIEMYAVSQSDDFQEVATPFTSTTLSNIEAEILAKEYESRITAIKEKDPTNYWTVDIPSYENILDAAKNNRIVTTDGGMAMVSRDGNLAGLFKDDLNKKGVAPILEKKRIEIGGIKKDNYDGYLTKIYQKSGFKVASRLAFNTGIAPKDWNQKLHGKPDVVFMVYDPNNNLTIKEKSFNKDQYDEALEYRDSFVEEAKKFHPFYKVKEPSLQSVTRFIAEQNENKEPLTPNQKVDLQNFILAVGEYNPTKLINLFFNDEGLFEVNTKKLVNSGYYSQYEATKILDDIDLQNNIKNSLEALKNNVEELPIIDYKIDNVEKVNNFTSFGKMQVLNPSIVEKELIQEVGGLSKSEFDAKVQDLPYQNINKEKLFEEASQYVEAEVLTEKNGQITTKPTEDTEVLIEQTAKLTNNQEFIDSLETSNITKEYEQAVLNNLGIDITGFSDMLFDAKLVIALQEFAKSPNKQNTQILAQEYNRVFDKNISPKKEKIKGNKDLKSHVKLENTTKTEEQLFQDNNLLKTGENTYIKITQKPLEELYQDVSTHFKEIKDLKGYVQDKIKKSDFINAENAEANYLYKMYFSLIPITQTDVNYALNQIEKGILLWNGDITSARIDLGISWTDIRKGEADLKRGKINSVPATRLVEAIIKAKREGGYRYKLGTGGENQRTTTFVSLEDMERSTNEYGLTDTEIEELNREQEREQKQVATKISSKFTGNYEYLTKDFVSDFYIASVKNKNSDKWKNYYSNFGINEKGLYLINDDALSLQNIKIYADENLKQYSLLSKQLPDLSEVQEVEYNSQTRRDNAVNFPETIKDFNGELYKISNKELILKNTTDEFLKIGKDSYELVETQGELSHYVKLDKNDMDYNILGVKQSKTENKLINYFYLNIKPNEFTTVKNYLTKEEKDNLEEDFNC